MMQIGFIGLGAMGQAMARNLAAAGHDVVAWNRSGRTVEGVAMAESAADVFETELVFTMLSDDDAIREVVLAPGLLSAARPGLVHIVSSTISVAFAHELVRAHAEAGVGYVAAPVLGRPDVAAKGELNVLLAGDAVAIAKARPLLEIVGGHIWEMGEAPPAANAAKIACNMMITMAIEAMAEAVILTEANGLPRDRFFELILGTLFGSRSYQVYSNIMSRGDYTPGFKATLGLKDLRLASEAAAEAGKALPMLAAVHARMGETVDHGWGDLDWSAMARFTLERG
jgi:3-hydroxyisobutyrate dehydrogenase-like beta-hydroxyacid dehydrogenase